MSTRPALETLVLQELRAINNYREYGFELFFWRTKHGLEVDLGLYDARGLMRAGLGWTCISYPCFGTKFTVRPTDTIFPPACLKRSCWRVAANLNAGVRSRITVPYRLPTVYVPESRAEVAAQATTVSYAIRIN